MREIKFRAWDITNKKMLNVNAIACLALGTVVSESYEFEKTSWIPNYELMQFTGLKDKNGKEIYEGDIVQFKYPVNAKGYRISTIAWGTAGFWVAGWLNILAWHEHHQIEVIGNLYENPELLSPVKPQEMTG